MLGAKLLASALILGSGFVAVSDDDYARVTIAQAFAHAPRLDPTGTSWLPAPFWVYGGVMMALGRSLEVARGTAFVLGLASAVIVYAAARRLWAGRPYAALAGALIAAIFPWGARLGVATVPELPAAALSLYALATLTPRASARARLLGGGALLLATLSRYEPWLLAVPFGLYCLWDARRAASRRSRIWLLGAAALALAGPALWVLHNHLAYGDALRFHARVTSYRRAFGAPSTWVDALGYPIAAAREEPELFVLVTLGAGLGSVRSAWPSLREARRPAALIGALILGLSLSAARDGAPTHHLARAWLIVLLFAALVAGRLLVAAADASARRLPVAPLACGALALIAGALARAWSPPLVFQPRAAEVALGREAARRLPEEAHLLVEVQDYGYLAVGAGFGRPERLIEDRSIDPRHSIARSSFDDLATLRRRIAHAHADAVVARLGPVTRALGQPLATSAELGLWAVVPTSE